MNRSPREASVTAVLTVAALTFVGTGVWAFAAPESFYDVIATYPPYNSHLVRDIGAFLVGVGAVQIGAVAWRDARFVALLGGTVAAALHWVSHVIDRHHGGSAADPWLTGALALLLLAGLILRTTAPRHVAPTDVPKTEEGANR
ncbi:MAG: hypothetical protein ACODAF_04655 [Actinomycetota bacterium]